MEKELINKKILNKNEIKWINKYHNKVKEFIKIYECSRKNELIKACSPI